MTKKNRGQKLTTDKKSLGKLGEEIAVSYLKKNGYKIIEQNFQKGYSEIDIVAQDKDTLVIAEVKTRTSRRYGHPAEAITPWKLRALTRSAYYYKLLHPKLPDLMRIDLVTVEVGINNRPERVEVIKNITS